MVEVGAEDMTPGIDQDQVAGVTLEIGLDCQMTGTLQEKDQERNLDMEPEAIVPNLHPLDNQRHTLNIRLLKLRDIRCTHIKDIPIHRSFIANEINDIFFHIM